MCYGYPEGSGESMKTIVTPIAAAMLGLPAVASAQADAGHAFFEQNCAVCHSVERGVPAGQGPGLFGVAGRKIGSAPGFGYSDALKAAGAGGERWTDTALDAFLAAPDKARPGTTMPVNVPAARDRAAVIAYLKTLKAPKNANGPRKLSDFPDMTPEAVTAATARAHDQGFDVWSEDKPGTAHRIDLKSLPKPLATANVGNPAKLAPRPAGALPQVPDGFTVSVFSDALVHPRNIVVAPDGDVFVAETAKGRVTVLRPNGAAAGPPAVYATGLNGPFGMAFYPSGPHPRYLYVADALRVVRYAYHDGDLAAGPAEVVVPKLAETVGGHATRTLVFTAGDAHMLVSVGAATNAANDLPPAPPVPLAQWEKLHGAGAAWGGEVERAAVLQFDPDGGHRQPYAQGLRNCVGMAIEPKTGVLLCTNNERDYLGDDLPPDFFTRVPKGSFFGWPWRYIGDHEDPRHAGERPDLAGRVRLPDTLIQPHSAPLGVALYHAPAGAAHAFGPAYEGDAFIALHSSGNRTLRTGSKLIRVHMKDGVPSDGYEDFMTGLVVDNNAVWGKPVGVAVAADGALLVSDDVADVIWRIAPKP